MNLNGPKVKNLSGKDPKQLIIFLHGLGSDGNDLISLAHDFSKFLPEALFLSPNAPFPCDMAPYGFQWFSLQQRDENFILNGIKQSAPILNNYIDEQLKLYNISLENLFLIGFSQGTMMSLYTALRRSEPIGGVIGFSGALIGASLIDEIISRPKVLLIHGDKDEVVPYNALSYAKENLLKNNVPVEDLTCEGLGHSINSDGLNKALEFLMKNINSK
jgi:phospholipase/carboxylesterase